MIQLASTQYAGLRLILTTSQKWASTHNHQTRTPAQMRKYVTTTALLVCQSDGSNLSTNADPASKAANGREFFRRKSRNLKYIKKKNISAFTGDLKLISTLSIVSTTKLWFYKKWAISGLFFIYFRLFKQAQFYNNQMRKNVHPV